MNERIKLLAEQATTYIEPTENSGEGWIFDKEKFAELIVRECINNYRRKHGEYLRTGRYIDEYEHSNNMLTELGFKQHFGVEE